MSVPVAIPRSFRPAMLILMTATLLGCTTDYQNVSLQSGQSNPERRSALPAVPDRPVILMAFSGGGARAAALAESVLAQMHQVTYRASDGTHHLTDDVTFVSSVSGGSVTAAWFGLHRAEKLDELRSRFLTLDNMGSIKSNLINPVFWVREAFTPYSRIDALEDLFDKRLFGKQTLLSDINQPGHPLIVFNASDMAGGETFSLIPSRFDDICSHYDALKLSTAVAASAAFPVALAPVTLKDFQPDCFGTTRSANWARIEQAAPQGQVNVTEYRQARYTNDLRHGIGTFRDISYIHLLDGGLADNLGVNAIRDALTRVSDETGLLTAINEGKIKKLVVIIVNARSDAPNALYQKRNASGLFGQLDAVTSVPIDANSQNAQQNIDRLLLEMARGADCDCSKAPNPSAVAPMQVYNVSVDFDTIAADTLEHRTLRDTAKAIPTSWNINSDQLATIDQAAALILNNDACYRQLVTDLTSGGLQPSAGLSCKTRIAHE